MALEGIDKLQTAMNVWLRSPKYRKELVCGQLVSDKLAEAFPPATAIAAKHFGGSIGVFLGIDVIIDEKAATPGTWKLLRHNHCVVDVDSNTVSHDNCDVLAFGEIREEHRDSTQASTQ
jgi:hypothetical protein